MHSMPYGHIFLWNFLLKWKIKSERFVGISRNQLNVENDWLHWSWANVFCSQKCLDIWTQTENWRIDSTHWVTFMPVPLVSVFSSRGLPLYPKIKSKWSKRVWSIFLAMSSFHPETQENPHNHCCPTTPANQSPPSNYPTRTVVIQYNCAT